LKQNAFSKSEEKVIVESITCLDKGKVKIKSIYFYSDWTGDKTHEIEIDKVFGFALRWRGDGWHVEVKTKEKTGEYDFRSYELSHEVFTRVVAEMIVDDRVVICGIINDGYDNFLEAIESVMTMAKNIKSAL
jgi:hypothetical protein